MIAWADRWNRPTDRSPRLAVRTPTQRLHGRDGVWALWVSSQSFDERALGLGNWDHDHEESGLPLPDRFSPAFMARFEAATRHAGITQPRVGFKLAGYVWDAEPGPLPDHPTVFYLGAIPDDD